MCMKTQGHVTQCHSQSCDFERDFETGLQSLSALSPSIVPAPIFVKPDGAKVHFSRSNIFMPQGAFEDATAFGGRAIAVRPDEAERPGDCLAT